MIFDIFYVVLAIVDRTLSAKQASVMSICSYQILSFLLQILSSEKELYFLAIELFLDLELFLWNII